jgi:tRNA threonylcarbamoyladenosine biosynthesis protein TsaB
VLDARRGEVFAALYSPGGERLWEPLVLAPADLAERVAALPDPPLAAGSGAVRFRDELVGRGVEVPDDADPVHRVAARHVCALAAATGGADPPAPIYLRPPDAERWRERDTFQTAE